MGTVGERAGLSVVNVLWRCGAWEHGEGTGPTCSPELPPRDRARAWRANDTVQHLNDGKLRGS